MRLHAPHAKVLLISGLLLLLFAPSAHAVDRAVLDSFGTPNGEEGGQLIFAKGVAVNRSGNGAPAGSVYVAEGNTNHRISQFDEDGDFIRAWGYDVVRSGEHNTGASEQQKLTLKAPSGGKFRLEFNGVGTGAAGTGTWSAAATTINVAAVSKGSFVVGQIINSTTAGIQEGTEVTGCIPNCTTPASITISKATTAASGGTTNRQLRGYDIPYDETASGLESTLNSLSTIGGEGGSVSVTRNEVSATEYEFTIAFGGAVAGNDVPAFSEFTTQGLIGAGKTAAVTTPISGGGFEVCEGDSSPADVCKGGSATAGAGHLANPQGIAIDQSNGYLYVTSLNNLRVDIFTGEGSFVGAFGYDVLPADPNPSGPDFCTTATGCQAAAAAGANAGRFSNLSPSIPAVDPNAPGRVYVPDPGNLRVNQYTITTAGDVLTGISFDKAFGWDVVPANATTTLESCTIATTCQAGTSGSGAGQFNAGGSPTAVAVDGDGAIYVTSGPLGNGTCSATVAANTGPCRVQKFAPDASSTTDFGPTLGPGQLHFTSGAANTTAAINLAIDPSNDHLYVLRKGKGPGGETPSSTEYQVHEYDSAGAYLATHPGGNPLTAVASTASTGLAVGTDERLYVNYGSGGAGQVFVLGPVSPPPPPTILPATEITPTSAKLNGEVTVPSPGGPGFDTKYRFEYSRNGFNWTSAPVPDGSVGSVAGAYPVEQVVKGLDPNTEYVVRIAASTSATVRSDVIDFTTSSAPPTIDSLFSYATQDTAVLGAKINPRSQATTYHFEWGTAQGAYPKRVPAFERQLGSGGTMLIAKEEIGGLEPDTTYYFRLIAENASGEVSAERQVTTLNSSGFPSGRRPELVSPADKGPVGTAIQLAATTTQNFFQAAEDGESIGYPLLHGLEDGTTGGESLFAAQRSVDGWTSTQASPPSLIPSPNANLFGARSGVVHYYSPKNLKCALIATHNPLTPDTPQVDVENGVTNLYRWDRATDEYTLITNRPPLDPTVGGKLATTERLYRVGASSDCSRIFFRSMFYSFFNGDSGLYEWEEGTLRDAGIRPDGSVAPGAGGFAAPGGNNVGFEPNTVSPDGLLFFVAKSNEGKDSGKDAIFVRKGPGEVVNASQPTTATASLGAGYELASRDGSKVFFTSNYGLTATSSPGPPENCTPSASLVLGTKACDLYRYDVDTGELIDISADLNTDDPKGAVVQGVLDVSEDGSVAYFAARGQLVPDQGRTYAENLAGQGFTNVYRWSEDEPALSYVGSLTEKDLKGEAFSRDSALVRQPEFWNSQTTSTGEYLLFVSRDNITGENAKNISHAYMYTASTEKLECISCPEDGVTPDGVRKILRNLSPQQPGFSTHVARSLSEDGRVFFTSEDALTPDAPEGKGGVPTEFDFRLLDRENNIYEWHEGQLSLLATGPVQMIDIGGPDGRDVFIRSFEQLSAEDTDFASDIYDLRIGGRLATAPPPPSLCNPIAGECQGSPSAPPSAPSPFGSSQSGPGNPPPAAEKKAKKKKKAKAKRKKQRRAKQHKGARKKQRAAKTNRGGAK